MTDIDEDVDTLIEETKQANPDIAEAMEQIKEQVTESDGEHHIEDIPDDLPLTGRDKKIFVLAGAFGSALEREYPANNA